VKELQFTDEKKIELLFMHKQKGGLMDELSLCVGRGRRRSTNNTQ
jgi:hypothetical protein